MKKEVSTPLAASLIGALIIGFILSHLLIRTAKTVPAPSVPVVPASFPDVKNDPRYNSFLNSGALDPTQAVPIGDAQNNSPFNGSQQ